MTTIQETFTNIANAIREKTGKTEAITPAQMPSEIRGISEGIGINGILEQYQVYAGETVNAGDFVEFVKAYSDGDYGSKGYHCSAIKLDNSRVLIAFVDNGNNKYGTACVIKFLNTSVNLGDKFVFSNESTSYTSLVYLDYNKALVAYRRVSDGYGVAKTLTISDNKISVESEITFCESSCGYISAIALNKSRVIVAFFRYSEEQIRVAMLKVNSENIAIQNEINLAVVNSSSTILSLTALNESKACIVYRTCKATVPYYYRKGTTLLVDDNGVSIGSTHSFGNYNSFGAVSVLALSEDKIFVIASIYNCIAYVYSIEGAVINTQLLASKVIYSAASGIVSAVKLSENRVLVVYKGENLYSTAVVATINADSITLGEAFVYRQSSMNYLSLLALSSSSVLVVDDFGYSVLQIDDTTISKVELNGGTFVRPSTSNIYIAGLANTGGSDGETVDVYVPNIQQ